MARIMLGWKTDVVAPGSDLLSWQWWTTSWPKLWKWGVMNRKVYIPTNCFFLGGVFDLMFPHQKNRHSKFIHLGWLQKFGSSLWYPNLQWFKYVSVTLGHFFLAAQGTFFLLKHFLFTSWMLVIKSSVLVWMLLLAASVLALAEALVAKGETLKTQLRSCHSPSKCGG